MGTRSLTYVYDESGKVIIKMYLQFDGYPSGVGMDLAKFLKCYSENPDNYEGYSDFEDSDKDHKDNDDNDDAKEKDDLTYRYIEMEKLSGVLVSHFFRTQGEYAMLISPFCTYYCCQDYEYHIYQDKVRLLEGEKEYEANWKTNEFKDLCSSL